MSLWGTLDIDDIPDDPYKVGEGSYYGFVSDARRHATKNGDKKVVIEYTVGDFTPEGKEQEYAGNTVSEWFDDPDGWTESEINALDPKERRNIIRNLSRLKKRVTHLGFDPKEIEDLSDLVETEVKFSVEESESSREDDDRVFYNVRYVTADLD